MACSVAYLPVPPERVFDVLADPNAFGDWVVGTDRVRGADADWPAPGTRIHHRVGVGPLKIDDDTEVLEAARPSRLVLHARALPPGTARVTLELGEHEGGATRVTMTEDPADLLSRLVHNPLGDRLIARRNRESLRRLGELAGAVTR